MSKNQLISEEGTLFAVSAGSYQGISYWDYPHPEWSLWLENPINEIPTVILHLPEWQVTLHLYMWEYVEMWRNSCTCYCLSQHCVNLRVRSCGMLTNSYHSEAYPEWGESSCMWQFSCMCINLYSVPGGIVTAGDTIRALLKKYGLIARVFIGLWSFWIFEIIQAVCLMFCFLAVSTVIKCTISSTGSAILSNCETLIQEGWSQLYARWIGLGLRVCDTNTWLHNLGEDQSEQVLAEMVYDEEFGWRSVWTSARWDGLQWGTLLKIILNKC